MKNPLSMGVAIGFLASTVGVLLGFASDDPTSLQAYFVWLLPAIFVLGILLVAHPSHRRFGTGLAIGSLSVAAAVFVFFSMLGAAIGS